MLCARVHALCVCVCVCARACSCVCVCVRARARACSCVCVCVQEQNPSARCCGSHAVQGAAPTSKGGKLHRPVTNRKFSFAIVSVVAN